MTPTSARVVMHGGSRDQFPWDMELFNVLGPKVLGLEGSGDVGLSYVLADDDYDGEPRLIIQCDKASDELVKAIEQIANELGIGQVERAPFFSPNTNCYYPTGSDPAGCGTLLTAALGLVAIAAVVFPTLLR